MTIGALESLEQMIADAISADTVIMANPSTQVHVDPQKNIEAEVLVKVAKLGTVIVPYVPEGSDDDSGIEGVNYGDVPFQVLVFQNAKIVNTGLTCRAVAERIAAIIKGNSGWPRNVFLRKPTIEHVPDRVLNIYQVNGQTSVDGSVLTALPAISAGNPVSGVWALTCAQPGAAIFYRKDGNLPTTSDILYTTPFGSVGGIITARAWLAGFLASPYLTLQT